MPCPLQVNKIFSEPEAAYILLLKGLACGAIPDVFIKEKNF